MELNSVVKVREMAGVGIQRKEKSFVDSVWRLAMSIQSLGESSLGRARMAIASISDQELQAKVVETFEKGCPNFDKFGESFHLITEKAYVEVLHCVCLLYTSPSPRDS